MYFSSHLLDPQEHHLLLFYTFGNRQKSFFFSPLFFSVLFLKNFLNLFLTVLSLCCCTGFSLVALSRGYSLVAVHRLLIAVASLVVEHML